VLIVFLYASTDEFHQMFVPTRTPMVSDVFIDTSGAIIGMILLWLLGRFFNWWPNAKKPAKETALPDRPQMPRSSRPRSGRNRKG